MDSQGALQIIEKKFIEKKWHGEMPVLYNFYGEASWLTPVLIQMVFCKITLSFQQPIRKYQYMVPLQMKL